MLNSNDRKQIAVRGISEGDINAQIENFRKGFPFTKLVAAATPGKGIITFNEEDVKSLETLWDEYSKDLKVVKFVPASGAASRMFKTLFEFSESYDGSEEAFHRLMEEKGFNSIYSFIYGIKDFAFYPLLSAKMKSDGLDIEACLENKDYKIVVDYLLFDKGLGYASLPKALLKFHAYKENSRIALEEHLVEGAEYCRSKDGIVYIHFTISPEHVSKFKAALKVALPFYENWFGIKYEVDYSVQKSSTDTIAVDMNNEPFREKNGDILFRPAGHGALLSNLNDIDADVVFIKNIDNVVPDRIKSETYKYKRVIGGLLLKLQKQVKVVIDGLNSGNMDINSAIDFAVNDLQINIDKSYYDKSLKEKIETLIKLLNRPIRICGMVRNAGEPGGGPFFTESTDGVISLQIVESSQVDTKNEAQLHIFKGSTHFNPVDLVCGLKNVDGEKFNLMQYVDHETGFISVKSKDGKELKAQELPGLWNGAMANWITLFVEVPMITFNPVKTVNDLLREEHRA